jgi:hypothetical protein
MGPDWSSVPSDGRSTGVEIDGAAGNKGPVPGNALPGRNHIVFPKRPVNIAPNPQNYDAGKAGIRPKEPAFSAKFKNIPELRYQAEICFQQSELTTDRSAKVRWLTLAEAWLMMANNIATREIYDGCGISAYQYLQQEDEGTLSQFLISSSANRRKYRRQRVLKEGKITNSEMRCLANVVIRDLSEGGARVQLPARQTLPDDFGLYIVAEGLLYPAVARWREENALGIQFVGEPLSTALLNGII